MHRTDLSDQIPGFIDLATSRLARDLRSSFNEKMIDPYSVSANPQTLPADFRGIRSLAVNTDSGAASLRYVGSHELNRYANNDGEPQVYSIRGRELWVRPYQARDYQLNYYSAPEALSAETSSNDILLEYPYLYLYASLIEANIYVQDEANAARMASIYTEELERVNDESKKARTGDAPAMRSV